jgi:hypothetical protein
MSIFQSNISPNIKIFIKSENKKAGFDKAGYGKFTLKPKNET